MEVVPLPPEVVQERLWWLSCCLMVDVVEGNIAPVGVKAVLDGGPSSGVGWEVNQTGLRRFLAVGRSEEEVVA